MLGTDDFTKVELDERFCNQTTSVDEPQDRVNWSVTILRHLLVWPSAAASCYGIFLVVQYFS